MWWIDGSLNALAQLVLIAAALTLAVRYGRKPRHWGNALAGTILSALAALCLLWGYHEFFTPARDGSYTPWWNDAPAIWASRSIPYQ